MQNSSVTVVNSSMVGNYVQDYEVQTGDRSPDGGAAYVWQDAVLILNSTLIKNNQATSGKGGGVMMGSNRYAGFFSAADRLKSALTIQDTSPVCVGVGGGGPHAATTKCIGKREAVTGDLLLGKDHARPLQIP